MEGLKILNIIWKDAEVLTKTENAGDPLLLYVLHSMGGSNVNANTTHGSIHFILPN